MESDESKELPIAKRACDKEAPETFKVSTPPAVYFDPDPTECAPLNGFPFEFYKHLIESHRTVDEDILKHAGLIYPEVQGAWKSFLTNSFIT